MELGKFAMVSHEIRKNLLQKTVVPIHLHHILTPGICLPFMPIPTVTTAQIFICLSSLIPELCNTVFLCSAHAYENNARGLCHKTSAIIPQFIVVDLMVCVV